MELHQITQYLIYSHIGLGGIALLAGATALIAKKGLWLHKKSGKVFLYSMALSAVISLVVALIPDHENSFLFAIGVMSLYFVISGYRSLRYKHKNVNLLSDKIISGAIIITGIFMIIFPILRSGKLNVILFVFGLLGVGFGILDLNNYRDLKTLRKDWLKSHLGKMTGGYIAAVSAFFIVNQILPGIWNWFTPGFVGAGFIVYRLRKLKGS
ncbi:MAG: putative membrane protein [Bacteroidia bacterium]|jgi:uncharacterized membrane protein